MPEHATSIHRTAGIKSVHATRPRHPTLRRRGSGRLSDQAALLFGADPTPRLLAFALAEDGRAIRVWQRHDEAAVATLVPFTPFLLLADRALIAGADGLLGVDALAGGGTLRWRARLAS